MSERGADHGRIAPAQIVLVIVLATGVFSGLMRAALIAPLHVPLDPNEGWNAYHAAAAVGRGNPYPPPDSFMINNYPPLSFYIVGVLGSLVGDNVLAGRLLSLGAFAFLSACIAIVLRRLNVHWSATVFATLLFASTLLLASDYVGMDDPQLFGHALQFVGLLLLLQQPRNSMRVVASAGVFVAGCFIKHNLFPLPLASFVWLGLVDRQNAIRFAAALLTPSLIGLVIVRALLGVNLLHELNSARAFSFAQLAGEFRDWLPIAIFPLCALAWLRFAFAKDEVVSLVSLYSGISILSGFVLLGGAGVDVNAMFDADIALSLCVGLALSRTLAQTTAGWRVVAEIFAVLCVAPLAVIALRAQDWRDLSFWDSPMREDAAVATADIGFLRARSGPAMCEDLTFCYWAGKQATVNVFNLDQQFETGARDPAGFLRLIRTRYFRTIELDETDPFPFPKVVETVILRNYRLDHQDDEGSFFIPR